MINPTYWKKYYVVESNADEIERSMRVRNFWSKGKKFELVYFEKDNNATNILISPGSGGHSYVFAELGYQIHSKGFNVFIMPKHGGFTITELMQRHEDAPRYIAANYSDRIGVFAEGLGGYACFYLALANGSMKSAVYMNAPAIMTEKKFQDAWMNGEGAARRRKKSFPFGKILYKIFPRLKLPIRLYLDFKELVDSKEENRKIEEPLIERFFKDSDFDRRYPLSAIMSLVYTDPPNPVSVLTIPTMFLVPVRGLFSSYDKDLYNRLPGIKKKLVEIDGGVFWMISHSKEAAKYISEWIDETLA